ncbi:uncharacterized protein EDB93DRAFT_1129866 [Suillus bovinus]|uniref:uncharacterized protein n=1 Tax=Suillus bovinus TaxID=48563 RepID=UPI001B883C5A|nr:uncharacterized protein EDB93DRAFT_1129866 [Suillus bovinus]KAG2155277.1 hypothetical protein EDB93DRAFT_1129866 [Suillus bovinus]
MDYLNNVHSNDHETAATSTISVHCEPHRMHVSSREILVTTDANGATPAKDSPDCFFHYQHELCYLELILALASNFKWHPYLFVDYHTSQRSIRGFCSRDARRRCSRKTGVARSRAGRESHCCYEGVKRRSQRHASEVQSGITSRAYHRTITNCFVIGHFGLL